MPTGVNLLQCFAKKKKKKKFLAKHFGRQQLHFPTRKKASKYIRTNTPAARRL